MQLIARTIKQNNAMIVPEYDPKLLLADNLKRLMDEHPDKSSPAKLSKVSKWPAGPKRGQNISPRVIAYLLDTRPEAKPYSPTLDLIVGIADAFKVPAWQLLVDDKQLRTWMVGKLFSAEEAVADSAVERHYPLPPSSGQVTGTASDPAGRAKGKPT